MASLGLTTLEKEDSDGDLIEFFFTIYEGYDDINNEIFFSDLILHLTYVDIQ